MEGKEKLTIPLAEKRQPKIPRIFFRRRHLLFVVMVSLLFIFYTQSTDLSLSAENSPSVKNALHGSHSSEGTLKGEDLKNLQKAKSDRKIHTVTNSSDASEALSNLINANFYSLPEKNSRSEERQKDDSSETEPLNSYIENSESEGIKDIVSKESDDCKNISTQDSPSYILYEPKNYSNFSEGEVFGYRTDGTTPVSLNVSEIANEHQITSRITEKVDITVPPAITPINISSVYKKILFYTRFFDGSWSKFLRNGRTDLAHHGCPVHQCLFTFDKSQACDADALIFHAAAFDPEDVPECRNPHQRYIWMNVEAPCLHQKTSKEKYHGVPGFFNWTATYHTESEILVSYGGMVPIAGDAMPSRLVPLDQNNPSYQRYIEVLTEWRKNNRLNKTRYDSSRSPGDKSSPRERREASNNINSSFTMSSSSIIKNSEIPTKTKDNLKTKDDLTIDAKSNRATERQVDDSSYSLVNSLSNSSMGESTKPWMSEEFLTRPKLVAWMVSHCNTVSGREFYVRELQRYVAVDVYGACGSLKCGNNHLDSYCYTDVLKPNYKFYLAFENSWCNNYITEKVWLPMEHGLVPVVYGGASFKDFLPPNSYIDATRLTPRELARILVRISSSDTEYASYHLWRDFWRVVVPVPFCDLCSRLHSDATEARVSDLGRWWGEVNNCSTRYPESQYPRPNKMNVLDYLKILSDGLGKANDFVQSFVHR